VAELNRAQVALWVDVLLVYYPATRSFLGRGACSSCWMSEILRWCNWLAGGELDFQLSGHLGVKSHSRFDVWSESDGICL